LRIKTHRTLHLSFTDQKGRTLSFAVRLSGNPPQHFIALRPQVQTACK
jgi:hypothetical protein